MKTALIYLHIAGKSDPTAPEPETYRDRHDRFYESWLKHGYDHADLHIVSCGGYAPVHDLYLSGLRGTFLYDGGGWDIGAHQYAMFYLRDYDFAICMNTGAYFRHPGFIQAVTEARQKYGDGLYGASGSFENTPHIRTTCWAVDPKTFAGYPMLVDDRAKTFEAESGLNSITNWYRFRKLPTMVVGRDGCFELMDCRKRENTFRKGDQSNDYVWDRHHDWFASASPELRAEFESRADGNPPNPLPELT